MMSAICSAQSRNCSGLQRSNFSEYVRTAASPPLRMSAMMARTRSRDLVLSGVDERLGGRGFQADRHSFGGQLLGNIRMFIVNCIRWSVKSGSCSVMLRPATRGQVRTPEEA